MGADGGSIPDRRDLVKTKARAEATDKAVQRELFFFCALSKRPLSKPVVLDPIGKLYNKDAVIEYFLDKSKYGDGDIICGHLKGVKDLLTLNLTDNPQYAATPSTTAQASPHAPFVCPLSLREMAGFVPFIALRPCGCVFSEQAVRAIITSLSKGPVAKATVLEEKIDDAKSAEGDVKSASVAICPNCGKEFDPTLATSIMPINPLKEVQEMLLENLLVTRAAAKSSKKRKAAAVDGEAVKVEDAAKEKKAAKINPSSARARTDSSSPAPTSNGRPSPAAPIANSLHRSVQEKLAEQERKRLAAKESMSDAVKSMFAPKDKGADYHKGNADFFGRTFTRYA